jgi:hypothetical protein
MLGNTLVIVIEWVLLSCPALDESCDHAGVAFGDYGFDLQ